MILRLLLKLFLNYRYEFETYKKFSLAFYTILMAYADELQAVSVDEALIDVTSQVHALATAPPEMDVTTEAPRDVEKVQLDVDSETKTSEPPEDDAETSAATPQPPSPTAPAVHVANVGTETPASPQQPTDWAKVLAEKIRSDVRKATGCEGSSLLFSLRLSPEIVPRSQYRNRVQYPPRQTGDAACETCWIISSRAGRRAGFHGQFGSRRFAQFWLVQ